MAIFPGSAIPSAAADYDIDNSLRFDDGDSPYLSRTPGSSGNRKTWTISCWFKPGNIDNARRTIFSVPDLSWSASLQLTDTASRYGQLRWNTQAMSGSGAGRFYTDMVFRDPSAWYHIVFKYDTTAAEASRMTLYVNGSAVTLDDVQYPILNQDTQVNYAGAAQFMGRSYKSGSTDYWDGYLAEFYLIDGTALDADSFGELDATTNQWIPKDASGLTFGTNGFYQKYGGTPLVVDSFTSTGAATWTCPAGVTSVEILTVAGGGGWCWF